MVVLYLKSFLRRQWLKAMRAMHEPAKEQSQQAGKVNQSTLVVLSVAVKCPMLLRVHSDFAEGKMGAESPGQHFFQCAS
jgi:hypothetical protein